VIFFFVVRPLNKLMARFKTEGAGRQADARVPNCLSEIPIAARRCAFCTSEVALPDVARVRTAQADALAAQGALREPWGGAVAAPRDLQLMSPASRPGGSTAATSPARPGPRGRARVLHRARRAVRAAGAGGDAVGARRLLFRRRLMALDRAAFRPAPAVPGLEVRASDIADLPAILRIDSGGVRPRPG
jgi:hypothetical protein